MSSAKITVAAEVKASVERVWNFYTNPLHIVKWNNASEDWHTPKAENDLHPGGKFRFTMAAKDGSSQFDFEGIYTDVKKKQFISYTIIDGRKVEVNFDYSNGITSITVAFDPETLHSPELQREGWQAILNNLIRYVKEMSSRVTMRFEVAVNAEISKVYNAMLDEKSFAEWTSVFNPTSHLKGSWQKGSVIHFLAKNKEGNLEGMMGRVKENIPNEFVSVEYIGTIINGEEITSGPEIEEWTGYYENYAFSSHDGITTVRVELDTIKEFENFFNETYPTALKVLKEICERK